MVEAQLLKKLKVEIEDLKRDKLLLKDENERLWKVIRALSRLECFPQVLSTSEDLLKMVMDILGIALEAVDSANGSILLLDEDSGELVFVAVVGERRQELMGYRIPAESGVAGWVNTHKKPTLVPDVRKDGRWISAVDQSIGFHTQSLMAVPLLMGERVLGVMEVVNALSEDHFNESDLVLMQLVARLASFVFGCTEEALSKTPQPISKKNLN